MVFSVLKEKTQPKQKAPKPKYNMAQNSWFMVRLAWTAKEKKVLVLGLLSALLALATTLVNLYLSPTILSAVERHVSMTELLLTIGGFVLGLMLVRAASAYVDENVIYGRITVRAEILMLLNRKACLTSYPNLDDDAFKKLLSKSTQCVNGNSSASEAIWATLFDLVKNLLGFAVYIGLLSSVQPLLMVVILVTTLINYFIGKHLNGYGYRHRDEEAKCAKHLGYFLWCANDVAAAKDIRIFGLRPWLSEIFQKAADAYMAFHHKAQSVYIWAAIADLVLSFLRNGIAYAYLIGLVLHQGISVAEFLLFFSAVGGFTQWVSGILSSFNTLYRQSLDISTVRECLDYPEPFRFEDGEPLQADPDRKYEIRLEHVSFRYPGAEKDVLTDINLTLHLGEKLAVVGLNGAGKTTLVKLICGFLDPTDGRVLLDGKDIRDYNRRDYYTMFSAVFQDFSLLACTVAGNVAQSEDNIDMERVKTCVDQAGLRAKIESLPQGYETNLNREIYEDAVLLSGGETQRLMLARALYKDAPFIVLDEPTAALDPIAESEMYHKYNEMTHGHSSIYISHRLASTRFCDRILMIADAKICEEGTHDQLMALGGKYAELFEVQSKYYKEGDAEYGKEEAQVLA